MNDGWNEIEAGEGDSSGSLVVVDSMSAVLERAQIDQQIATARKYPRSLPLVMKRINQLVTLDPISADECMYALPRCGKPITGPSIRLAEIIASNWGNCHVGARPLDIDRKNKTVEAEGVFWDIETNVRTVKRVWRRVSDKGGRIFNDDMILVTSNAACSIALRNAIVSGVPKAVWRSAYEAAVAIVKGDAKTLSERKASIYKTFAAFGIKPDQIWVLLAIAGDEEITVDHIPVLTGYYQALKSGEATVDDLFFANKPAATKVISNPLNDADPETGEVTKQNAGDDAPSAPAASAEDAATSPVSSASPQQTVAETAGNDEAAPAAVVKADKPNVPATAAKPRSALFSEDA